MGSTDISYISKKYKIQLKLNFLLNLNKNGGILTHVYMVLGYRYIIARALRDRRICQTIILHID